MSPTGSSHHDFVVVGAGPAGCMVARRLACSKQRPRVLLIEAGGRNDDKFTRIPAERWMTGKMHTDYNWSYKTVPQKSMDDRILEYDRGKGLGGSSAINFAVWTVASKDDHDFLAKLVDDPEWRWENARERYKRIENHHFHPDEVAESFSKYMQPRSEDHGTSGPIHIGYPLIWEDSFAREMDGLIEHGFRQNKDSNSGDPIGVSAAAATVFRGIKSTAADALKDCPQNLEVVTEGDVARVLFEGKTAIGVETLDGRKFGAAKEVILCCGSIDSPKILLHSGIGPAAQLERFKIKVVDANDAIGQNLQDHPFIYASWPRKESLNERLKFWGNSDEQKQARLQWERDGSGPLADISGQLVIGWLKNNHIASSEEYKQLPKQTREHIAAPTTPHYEFTCNMINFDFIGNMTKTPPSISSAIYIQNPQSRGTVSLSSSDPADPVAIDLNMLSHPYDQRAAIEATRTMAAALNSEPDSKIEGQQYIMPPISSEEEILGFWRATASATWHGTGTVRMGKDFTDAKACVNNRFQLRNISRLRVADMSVVPVLPNNHTQTTAYLVGLMAGDKLVQEYGLDS